MLEQQKTNTDYYSKDTCLISETYHVLELYSKDRTKEQATKVSTLSVEDNETKY